jgi:hypothetical protein
VRTTASADLPCGSAAPRRSNLDARLKIAEEAAGGAEGPAGERQLVDVAGRLRFGQQPFGQLRTAIQLAPVVVAVPQGTARREAGLVLAERAGDGVRARVVALNLLGRGALERDQRRPDG